MHLGDWRLNQISTHLHDETMNDMPRLASDFSSSATHTPHRSAAAPAPGHQSARRRAPGVHAFCYHMSSQAAGFLRACQDGNEAETVRLLRRDASLVHRLGLHVCWGVREDSLELGATDRFDSTLLNPTRHPQAGPPGRMDRPHARSQVWLRPHRQASPGPRGGSALLQSVQRLGTALGA